MGMCVRCHSHDTEVFKDEDGWRKRCFECGHVAGPWGARPEPDDDQEQTTLERF